MLILRQRFPGKVLVQAHFFSVDLHRVVGDQGPVVRQKLAFALVQGHERIVEGILLLVVVQIARREIAAALQGRPQLAHGAGVEHLLAPLLHLGAHDLAAVVFVPVVCVALVGIGADHGDGIQGIEVVIDPERPVQGGDQRFGVLSAFGQRPGAAECVVEFPGVRGFVGHFGEWPDGVVILDVRNGPGKGPPAPVKRTEHLFRAGAAAKQQAKRQTQGNQSLHLPASFLFIYCTTAAKKGEA